MGSYQTLQPKGFPPLPTHWKSEVETIPSIEEEKIYTVFHWNSSVAEKHQNGVPARILGVLHGRGEHCGRYLHFPHYLSDSIDGLFTFDHFGHGRSGGLRGHIRHFDDYVLDTKKAIELGYQKARDQFGNVEFHLLGHSMGGLILLRYLLSEKQSDQKLAISSYTVSSPLLGIAVKVPVVKQYGAYVLSKFLGALQLTLDLESKDLSHDLEVADLYTKDELVTNKVTPQFFVELEKALEDTNRRASELTDPIQFLISMKDRIADPQASIQFYDQINSKDKKLVQYEGFYHEAFNEVEKQKVFKDLQSWILCHSKKMN